MEKFGQSRTGHMTMWRMRFECRITKLHTHSEYVTTIAFQQQQSLHECALMLRLYVHCLTSFLTF